MTNATPARGGGGVISATNVYDPLSSGVEHGDETAIGLKVDLQMILPRHGLGLVLESARGLAVLDQRHGATALAEEGSHGEPNEAGGRRVTGP